MSPMRILSGTRVVGLGVGLFGVALAGAVTISARPPQASDPGTISFNRQILPILAANCFACHGPDEKARETKFHFDTEEGAFAEKGIIERGDPARSVMIRRVTSTDPDEKMPPPDSGHSLTDAQIDLLRRWIDQGAKWDTHWAYTAPERPEPPVPANFGWVRNPIDQFVLARLEREGLKPSPEADKVTLLRRVTFDLTGLPPTPAEIDAFLADGSPDAYERRVDALLQSPRYGERMAIGWLDVARYADTHGYHIDSHRTMWPWRDWVIGAFNSNLPYDRFVVEQLAGDLLPGATREQKVASGFNRNHMINFEGGAIAEEYQVEYVVDRVETTSTAFMGLTMGCARCHTHKFDPITHTEFYQFYAFFNNVSEQGLDGRTGNAVPLLPLPSDRQQTGLEALDQAIALREQALDDKIVEPLQQEWARSLAGRAPQVDRSGLIAHYELDGNLSDISGAYRHGRTLRGDPVFEPGQIGRAVGFDADSEVSFGDVGGFDRQEPFTLAVWLKGRGRMTIPVLRKMEGDERGRGYEWFFDDAEIAGIQRWAGKLNVVVRGDPAESAIHLRTRERLKQSEWAHVAMVYDGSGKAKGLTLYVDGRPAAVEVLRDTLSGVVRSGAPLRVTPPFPGALDDLRLYSRALDAGEVEHLALHYRPQVIVSGVTGKPTKDEAAALREYYLTHGAPEHLRAAHAELKKLRLEKAQLQKDIPTVMVMDDNEPRETFVLARGDYRNKTDKVEPGVPSMLPPLPKDAPRNRLTLAKWLVHPRHPLTARVAVNRYWQGYFGLGIVKTQEDFGVQGEPPVHPELLDWLATEFVRTNWDVRAMQRLIVTSATYRQNSEVTPELLDRDPENRLHARGPRTRLPAEMIRDTALAASGLLNGEIGGPSVLPYQPPGVWEELAFGDGFSAQSYEQSRGSDLYRRGLYTFWKRTAPPVSFAAFDAPDREKCTARRAQTNTPLQALVLLNDPTYVEASRALAQRALLEGGRSEASRIAYAFRLATARVPERGETRVLRDLLQKGRATYARDPQAAAKLLDVGESARDTRLEPAELAAWTTVTSVILNLDETVTKQ